MNADEDDTPPLASCLFLPSSPLLAPAFSCILFFLSSFCPILSLTILSTLLPFPSLPYLFSAALWSVGVQNIFWIFST